MSLDGVGLRGVNGEIAPGAVLVFGEQGRSFIRDLDFAGRGDCEPRFSFDGVENSGKIPGGKIGRASCRERVSSPV